MDDEDRAVERIRRVLRLSLEIARDRDRTPVWNGAEREAAEDRLSRLASVVSPESDAEAAGSVATR